MKTDPDLKARVAWRPRRETASEELMQNNELQEQEGGCLDFLRPVFPLPRGAKDVVNGHSLLHNWNFKNEV